MRSNFAITFSFLKIVRENVRIARKISLNYVIKIPNCKKKILRVVRYKLRIERRREK